MGVNTKNHGDGGGYCDCCIELQQRVSSLEAFKQTQERDIDRLVGSLGVTNEKLGAAINVMTEIKTTQRITHVIAGFGGTALGGALQWIFHKVGLS